uniref:Fibronectin type-III domain-containing protein n=1 Tax=Amphimedon queenslandica TaxID=400682 RepID=A0A1X7SJF1_AMPQE
IQSISWTLVSSIRQLSQTMYRIDCIVTTEIDPLIDIHWLVNGDIKNSSMFTLLNDETYNISLLINPDPLGVSVNVSCVAKNDGSAYSKFVQLHAPTGPPSDVQAFILDNDSIKVNWTSSGNNNGFAIEYSTKDGSSNVVLTREFEITLYLPMNTYFIIVYSYVDLPSINGTSTMIMFDIPSPITSFVIFNISSSNATLKWTNENRSYITYYVVSLTSSCFEISPINKIISVNPYESTSIYNITFSALYSGMDYTVKVRAGNVLGESNSKTLNFSTIST